MQEQNISSPPKPPKRYLDDSAWGVQNIQRLAEEYPNEWVAIFKKRIVAHSADLEHVFAAAEANELDSPVIKFIEGEFIL